MSRRIVHDQFFTQAREGDAWKWFPMDHFFYATYDWTPGRGLKKSTPIVQVEANGNQYHVLHGRGLNTLAVLDTWPQALRRMADIIEAHQKKKKKCTG